MNNLDSENNKNLNYQVYLDERKSLVDAKREGTHSFDKAILTLAGGAFGLSLTFIRQFKQHTIPNCKFMLALAWTGFCISMLSTLISFLTSQSACSKQIEILEVAFCSQNKDVDTRANQKNNFSIWTKRLNVISIFSFIAGTICLAYFTIINL